jgi:hypothetical protein
MVGEIIHGIPLLDQAASELYYNGQFQTQLTGDDLALLAQGVLGSLLNQRGDLQLAPNKPPLVVAEINPSCESGHVTGWISMLEPVFADISIEWTLANDPESLRQRIITVPKGIIVRETPYDNGSNLKLAIISLQEMAEKKLGDPNAALREQLGAQLKARRVSLTGQTLQFTGNTLFVGLSGGPLPLQP